MRVRLLPLFLLLAVSGTAIATSTGFDLAPGEDHTFLVTGWAPSLRVTEGSVTMDPPVQVGPNAWLVTLHCASSSASRCQGTIES